MPFVVRRLTSVRRRVKSSSLSLQIHTVRYRFDAREGHHRQSDEKKRQSSKRPSPRHASPRRDRRRYLRNRPDDAHRTRIAHTRRCFGPIGTPRTRHALHLLHSTYWPPPFTSSSTPPAYHSPLPAASVRTSPLHAPPSPHTHTRTSAPAPQKPTHAYARTLAPSSAKPSRTNILPTLTTTCTYTSYILFHPD